MCLSVSQAVQMRTATLQHVSVMIEFLSSTTVVVQASRQQLSPLPALMI